MAYDGGCVCVCGGGQDALKRLAMAGPDLPGVYMRCATDIVHVCMYMY